MAAVSRTLLAHKQSELLALLEWTIQQSPLLTIDAEMIDTWFDSYEIAEARREVDQDRGP